MTSFFYNRAGIKLSLLLFVLFLSSTSFSQVGEIRGTVKDVTGIPMIGANVLIGTGTGTVTDIDGNFLLKDLKDTSYTVTISYVGFETISLTVNEKSKATSLRIELKSITLDEVEVVSDVAIARETPVAFTNIPSKKLSEELAAQDVPLVLNSTPGVYATQQGGGDGDARITIRGFNQRNVAVMIDGIPVNDMENGWVYWSNWFGLDMITRTIQVQRGLGASKLALPSVGGTINILTKGIEDKRTVTLTQDVASDGYLLTALSLTTGKLKNGWGVTMSGAYKKRDGWVEQTWTKAWAYYLKVEKNFKNHAIGLTAYGSPQQHGQRTYKLRIAEIDKDYAANLGVDTTGFTERGLKYNPNWGYLTRTDSEQEVVNQKLNHYHKPQFNLKHFWNIKENIALSNILYVSIGNGGGTSNQGTSVPEDESGHFNYQKVYDGNILRTDLLYSDTEHKSTAIIRSAENNHKWYGYLSTLQYQITKRFIVSGGADIRYYKGEHYNKVYDLLGGDYYIDNKGDKNQSSPVKRKGDKILNHYDGIVNWAGGFGQVEYKVARWSTFLNITGANTWYKRIDYFKRKDILIGDTAYVQAVGFNDTIFINGNYYTVDSKEARFAETERMWIAGYTFKTGGNFNITDHLSVFTNLGYLNKAPRFNNVFDSDNFLFLGIKNEKIKAWEAGFLAHYRRFSTNINCYYTIWENKPVDYGSTVIIGGDEYTYNINGVNALHKGAEIDFAYYPFKKVELEGLVSLGDWIWNSKDTVRIYDASEQLVGIDYFDARGVHVGDAAQTQYAGSIRYEIIRGLYAKAKFTYFDRYYADFDPVDLKDENAGRESWKMPAYYLVDFHTGYRFNISKVTFNCRFNILNVLNKTYVSDAADNYNGNNFDAASAGVFFGLGRRYTVSLQLTL